LRREAQCCLGLRKGCGAVHLEAGKRRRDVEPLGERLTLDPGKFLDCVKREGDRRVAEDLVELAVSLLVVSNQGPGGKAVEHLPKVRLSLGPC